MWRPEFEQEQLAFLLHSRPFQENKQIVELLTENDGRVAAVVYVSDTKKSNKKGLLQPFLPLNVVLSGQNKLKKLKRIEAAGKSWQLSADHLYSAFYINELLVRLLPESLSCPELYQQYKKSISELAEKQPIEPSLRTFECTLLNDLGLAIDFTFIHENVAPYYAYVAEVGLVVSDNHKAAYSRQHLVAIAEHKIDDAQVLNTYKRLMRDILKLLLGDKPLNSRKLFTKVK